MAASRAAAPYESPALQAVIGPALRPGGLALTGRALNFCDLPPGAPVVDIGCGTGLTVDFLRQHHRLAAFGLDRSAIMLGRARQQSPGTPLVQAAATCLPFGDARLAAVICECVLSLVADTERLWRELTRVLAPGGYLVVTDVYVREPHNGRLLTSIAWDGCLKGARSRDWLLHRLRQSRLGLLVWEDHSRDLKRLAAQLAWAGLPLCGTGPFADDRAAGLDARRVIRHARPGYFLMVARKRGRR